MQLHDKMLKTVTRLLWDLKFPIVCSLDCEYVTIGMPTELRSDPKHVITEIVKICCVKYDIINNKEIDHIAVFVKPTHVNNANGDFLWFKDLTGITQDDLDNGIDLSDAINQLKEFVGILPIIVMRKDPDVLYYDTKHRCIEPWDIEITHKVFRLKPNISVFFNVLNIKTEKNIKGGDLYKLLPKSMLKGSLAINKHIIVHDSLWNARSTACFIAHVLDLIN